MGKDGKEDSGFGFKDQAKAEETLKLLQEHDMNYRRLTVRGLLGRAKRVLSLTKAEDKIANIKAAMQVFETWLEENQSEKSKADKRDKEKKRDENKNNKDVDMEDENDASKTPSDTVPGLGFKDKAAAQNSIKILDGRDPDYQKLAVKGLIGRAKRVLTCTKDETKVSNIKEAMSVFDKFLDDFDTMHLHKEQNTYLPVAIVLTCLYTAEERGIDVSQQQSFIDAYKNVNGEYKKLRTVTHEDTTWDIVRNRALKTLKDKYSDIKLFNEKDEPTDDHLQLILWAYSPDASRCKKYIKETHLPSDKSDRKRRSSANDDDETKKRKE